MSTTKRQELPSGLWPGLWIVATPIGNLADLTPRASLALRYADEILAEDTRRASQLLQICKISPGRVHRLDEHTPPAQIANWVSQLAEGKNLALISDAGTPGVSDPGALLCAEAAKARIRISPVPGVSAVTALVSVSGVRQTGFCFQGFFPREVLRQKQEIKNAKLSGFSGAFIWFESPKRIVKSLETIANEFPDAKVVVGKELTKIHEKIFNGSAKEVFEQVHEEIDAQGTLGEWCFLVSFAKSVTEGRNSDMANGEQSEFITQNIDEKSSLEMIPDDLDKLWKRTLSCLKIAGVPLSQAVSVVSQEFGIRKKTVYSEALLIFEKKERPGG